MSDATKNYERDELIDLCQRGVVPVTNWSNRDSADAQRQLGEALALLRADCEFHLAFEPKSDEQTIWVSILHPGFQAFEYGSDDRAYWESNLFYVPTDKRLLERAGLDWY